MQQRRNRQIHLVSDRKQARGDLIQTILSALRGGIDWVQLREKGGPALRLYEDALRLTPAAREIGAQVAINDRVDVALAARADGIHLAGKSLPPEVVRSLVPSKSVLGVSVHGLEEARAVVGTGASYVTFGHVYPTSSKPGMAPRGVRDLAKVVEGVEVPVLAVGGIDATNVREVLATGASGVAVISSILAAEDPEEAARELRCAVDESPSHPRHPFVSKEAGEATEGGKHASEHQPRAGRSGG